MQKTDKSQKGAVMHRRVKTSTVKSRKDLARPKKMAKIEKKRRSIVVIDRDLVPEEPRATKNEKRIEVLVQEQMEEQRSQMSVIAAEQPAKMPKLEAERTQVPEVEVKQVETKSVEMPRADMARVHERMRARTEMKQPERTKISAKELKEQAIKKALGAAEKTVSKMTAKKNRQPIRVHFGLGRVVLALSCAAAVVFAIVYFVNLNAPDISFKVAAMQTGIEASYPSYVPRDFNLSDITSENGKITLNFQNTKTGESFSLIEEKSAWDSNALLENFVKDKYGDDHTVLKENGLTIYVKGGDAAWVNGGVFYRLEAKVGALTKKQIRTMAAST